MLIHFRDQSSLPAFDLCVIGAGPVGIALAIAAEAQGLCVLLIESGGEAPGAFTAGLSQAILSDACRHAPMDIAVCRGLGGTSRWWGGRLVPYDDFDFSHRADAPGTEWPLEHTEIKAWYDRAAKFLGTGKALFSNQPQDWTPPAGVRLDQLERWVPHINIGTLYRRHLEASSKICLLLDATVTELRFSADRRRIESVVLGNETHRLAYPVCRSVLACGGLETTRLLLVAQQAHPCAFGGTDGVLGRFYMGHMFGKIADIILDDPASVAIYDFFLDGPGFARRRISLSSAVLAREKLSNIAFWVDNPPFFDPAHKSGILSLVWLALAMPFVGKRLSSEGVRQRHVGARAYRSLSHIGNVFLAPFATLASLAHIIKDRYLSRPRKPGFLVRNPAGRYALEYHGEHLPDAASRVTLSDQRDALGVPRLAIDLRYGERDAQSVLRAHDIFDAGLRAAGAGRLEYRVKKDDRLAAIMAQATDGFHQIGTTRMGLQPETSVVDPDCRVHGMDNLFIASSSIFPSSGQANPTFLAVAFALRLAQHLAQQSVPKREAENARVALPAGTR